MAEGWSYEAVDFINRVFVFVCFFNGIKLIQRKPKDRLGVNGPKEVKKHPWLKDFPFDDLVNHNIIAPYQPSVLPNPISLCLYNINIGIG